MHFLLATNKSSSSAKIKKLTTNIYKLYIFSC